MKEPNLAELNDALLEGDKGPSSPRRNSKDDLIRKILTCCEDGNIELEHSDTKLKRMNKQQLIDLLADCLEKRVRNGMADSVGAAHGACDTALALGALKMIHSIAANTTEKGLNIFLPGYGYEVDGFADGLKQPAVAEAVDACLEEIAADSDILEYVKSPYSRLAIAWSGALLTSLRKAPPTVKKNASRVEPRQIALQVARERRAHRGPPDGKEQLSQRPPPADAKTV